MWNLSGKSFGEIVHLVHSPGRANFSSTKFSILVFSLDSFLTGNKKKRITLIWGPVDEFFTYKFNGILFLTTKNFPMCPGPEITKLF